MSADDPKGELTTLQNTWKQNAGSICYQGSVDDSELYTLNLLSSSSRRILKARQRAAVNASHWLNNESQGFHSSWVRSTKEIHSEKECLEPQLAARSRILQRDADPLLASPFLQHRNFEQMKKIWKHLEEATANYFVSFRYRASLHQSQRLT